MAPAAPTLDYTMGRIVVVCKGFGVVMGSCWRAIVQIPVTHIKDGSMSSDFVCVNLACITASSKMEFAAKLFPIDGGTAATKRDRQLELLDEFESNPDREVELNAWLTNFNLDDHNTYDIFATAPRKRLIGERK